MFRGEFARLARNRVRPVGADDTDAFDLTTIPTPLQRETLECLGIAGRMYPESRGPISAMVRQISRLAR